MGDVFQDVVLKSIGELENLKRFSVPNSVLKKSVVPDVVENSIIRIIDPYAANKMKKIEFVESHFIDAKYTPVVKLEPDFNSDQLKGMIDVLSEQKGAYVNDEYVPDMKASDYGMAALTLITPANTTIDPNLVAYATEKRVNLIQRTTEEDESNSNRVRVGPVSLPLNHIVSKTDQLPNIGKTGGPGQSDTIDIHAKTKNE